jgi:hypothetical protein
VPFHLSHLHSSPRLALKIESPSTGVIAGSRAIKIERFCLADPAAEAIATAPSPIEGARLSLHLDHHFTASHEP